MQDELKQNVAKEAVKLFSSMRTNGVLGIGTGSTVNYFIEALKTVKGQIDATVSSSKQTTELLKAAGIPVVDLNSVNQVDLYFDGADEVTEQGYCIKGGGGALTGEKIIAEMAKTFVCMVDESKVVKLLGRFPLPIEVIPMARSLVAREMVKLGGDPVYREGFVSDYGNCILDVHNLDILEPIHMEEQLDQLPGVVTNGLFAKRPADILLIAEKNGVKKIEI